MLAGQLNQEKVEQQMAGEPLKGNKEDHVFVFITKHENDYNLRKYQTQVLCVFVEMWGPSNCGGKSKLWNLVLGVEALTGEDWL